MMRPGIPPMIAAVWNRWRGRARGLLVLAARRALGWIRRRWWLAPVAAGVAILVVAVHGTRVVEVPWSWADLAPVPGDADASEVQALTRALEDLAPRGAYIVVDQTNNRLYLKEGDRVLREAVCSAGSGMVLRDSEKGRVWVFDTPRGVFRVQKKARNPVWKKPDWAFIEEGKRPPARASERIEVGTLGEYALYLGDGYMIHGTLYERLLGRSVTHGCIRLGKEDLRAVHDAAEVGTEVYIF